MASWYGHDAVSGDATGSADATGTAPSVGNPTSTAAETAPSTRLAAHLIPPIDRADYGTKVTLPGIDPLPGGYRSV